ncbi:colanic acid biosynthesis acetyltransferase WcaF [soil metagenome]
MSEQFSGISIVEGADGRHQPSFTATQRLKRVVWNITYILIFRWTPRPMHEWRSMVLRLFGAKVGKHVHVYGKAKIWAPWNLILEDEASIAEDVTVYSIATITLKKKAIVSQNAYLCTGSHDYTSRNFQLVAFPIVIGENAWVCTDAFIGPGVTIGKDCVIGARAVATKDMPEGMVCAGHPARSIKKRYATPDE